MDTPRDLTRIGACAGAVAAVLYLISLAMLSGAPTVTDSGAQVTAWFGDHRSGVLVAAVANGVAWLALMPLFAAGLRERLGGCAGRVVLAAALVEAALIGVIVIALATLAFRAPDVPASSAVELNDMAAFAFLASAWPTVLMLAAALSARLPRLVAAPALLALAMHALGGCSVAREGLFSPTGAFALLAPPCFAIFLLAAAAWMLRVPASEPTRIRTSEAAEL